MIIILFLHPEKYLQHMRQKMNPYGVNSETAAPNTFNFTPFAIDLLMYFVPHREYGNNGSV